MHFTLLFFMFFFSAFYCVTPLSYSGSKKKICHPESERERRKWEGKRLQNNAIHIKCCTSTHSSYVHRKMAFKFMAICYGENKNYVSSAGGVHWQYISRLYNSLTGMVDGHNTNWTFSTLLWFFGGAILFHSLFDWPHFLCMWDSTSRVFHAQLIISSRPFTD